MKYIIGLGNPGPHYVFTKHNVGFLCIDRYIEKKGKKNFKEKNFLYFQSYFYDENLVLIKPTTYMNLSGKAILEMRKVFGEFEAKDILVIYDDVDLIFGKIRIRLKGSSGGHNGVKSIIQALMSQEFPRLKIGIGPKPANLDLADYVLSEFSDKELEKLWRILEVACEAIDELLEKDPKAVMAKYNGMKIIE